LSTKTKGAMFLVLIYWSISVYITMETIDITYYIGIHPLSAFGGLNLSNNNICRKSDFEHGKY